jgi:hypothetical protein
VALEAVALEELAQEVAQDVGMGARMEGTSHYVSTAERMGSTSLTTASCYQRMRARSWQISLMGSFCVRRRWNDMDQGKIVIA